MLTQSSREITRRRRQVCCSGPEAHTRGRHLPHGQGCDHLSGWARSHARNNSGQIRRAASPAKPRDKPAARLIDSRRRYADSRRRYATSLEGFGKVFAALMQKLMARPSAMSRCRSRARPNRSRASCSRRSARRSPPSRTRPTRWPTRKSSETGFERKAPGRRSGAFFWRRRLDGPWSTRAMPDDLRVRSTSNRQRRLAHGRGAGSLALLMPVPVVNIRSE